MYRLRPKQKAYDNHLGATRDRGCPFCALDDPVLNPDERYIAEETACALVIDNMFPYDAWEGYKVTEHLMLIPKRHVHSLGELTKAERADIMDLYCKYETAGYNIYSRAPGSGARTHGHVHTHLIKIEGDPPRRFEYIKQPYQLTIEW